MIKLGFDDLTPAEAHKLLDFYAAMRGADPVSQSIQGARYSEIERTAAELVGNVAAPAAPVAAPSPAASVPGGAPSTGHSTAAVNVMADTRGVPFNPDHHSGTRTVPGRNADGSWKRRRGHDPKALQTYEEQFLAGKRVSTADYAALASGTPASTAPSPVGGGQPAPVADPNQPASWPPAPPPPPAPPLPGPTYEEFARLWTTLCAAQRVTIELETWIKTTYGGHPTLSDVFRHNHVARAQVYGELMKYETPAAA